MMPMGINPKKTGKNGLGKKYQHKQTMLQKIQLVKKKL